MGVMLSCSVAVKFVGIFVVVFVGIRTIADLWEILGDISRPVVLLHFSNLTSMVPYLIILMNVDVHRKAFYGPCCMSDCHSNIAVHGHFLYPFGGSK
jgi:dolichyl-phosphate-mannose--protein O-mannosyl transferase